MKQYNILLTAGLVVFHMVFSFAWYSIFSKDWLAMSRITAEQASGVNPMVYILSMVVAALSCYTFIWLFDKLRVNTAKEGAKMALIIGISFFFLEVIVMDLFSIRPLKLALINGGNFLVFLTVAGAVLGGYRKN